METFFKQPAVKGYKAKSFSPKTIEAIRERDDYACVLCGAMVDLEPTPHHVYYRSEINLPIINWKENGVNICRFEHDCVTNKTETNHGKELDLKLKLQSLARFKENPRTPKTAIKALEAVIRRRHGMHVQLL